MARRNIPQHQIAGTPAAPGLARAALIKTGAAA